MTTERGPPGIPDVWTIHENRRRTMNVELDGARVRYMRGSRAFNGALFARRAGISPETLRRVGN